MKITKFVHSCVLVEEEGETVLYDPGTFSWASGLIDIDKFPKLNTIVVSHKHPDHFSEDFVEQLIAAFPEAQWYAPTDLLEILQSMGAKNATNKSTETVEIEVKNHAAVEPFGVQVLNATTHWRGKVTSTGDTHEVAKSAEVLLMPVQAPWGTTVHAMEVVLQLKPKFIVPVHDWMWNEQWKNISYDRFEDVFTKAGITFIRPVDGQPNEIQL